MPWYHGRSARSRRFALEFVGGESANDQEGPGFYFTTLRSEAGQYAYVRSGNPGVVLEADLAVTRWVPTTGRTPSAAIVDRLMRLSPCYREALEDWDEHPGRAARVALQAMLNAKEPPHQTFLRVWADFYLRCGRSADYLRAMVQLGYQGVKIHHPAGPHVEARTHAIIFDPAVVQNVRVVEDRGSGPVEGLGGARGFGRRFGIFAPSRLS